MQKLAAKWIVGDSAWAVLTMYRAELELTCNALWIQEQLDNISNTTNSEEELCQYSFWPHSTPAAEAGYCNCKDWYWRNQNRTLCEEKQSLEELCQEIYGSNAIASTRENECTCKVWYSWNENEIHA